MAALTPEEINAKLDLLLQIKPTLHLIAEESRLYRQLKQLGA
jgi:hypothetical protein